MISLEQVEKDLVTAMKAKDSVALETLRGLKVRIQNEKIAKLKDLSESDIVALIRSEVKRRKESATAFTEGGRADMAEKELAEAGVLEKYLPAQMSEQQILEVIEKVIAENNFVAKDFGVAMGKVKATVGDKADGGTVAKLLKEKLK